MSDPLSYAIEKLGLQEVKRLQHEGITAEEMTAAIDSIIASGGVLKDPSEETPKPEKRKKKIPLTKETLCDYLDESGYTIRLNVITHEVEISGLPDIYNPESRQQDLPVIIHDEMKTHYRCDKQNIIDLLSLIAGENRYNPVLELIDSGTWDKHDYLGELYEILHIGEDDLLSRTLIYKWLAQSYWMLQNDIQSAFGADGMLVLQGPQGIGKTSFVRKIAIQPEFAKLGQYLDFRDKDTLRRCISAWITELGEIETTFRSDLERLKAFITAERDEYRLPYGRADVKVARRTSLIGTCNSGRFLIDPTGSRRFWTIPVNEIDLKRLFAFDSLQLWRQIKVICKGNPAEFRLTKEEQEQLAARNHQHEKPLKAQEEIEDILTDVELDPSGFEYRFTTISEFKAEYSSLSRYSVEQIGRALDKLDIKQKRKRISGDVKRVRYLPCHKWGCTLSNPPTTNAVGLLD